MSEELDAWLAEHVRGWTLDCLVERFGEGWFDNTGLFVMEKVDWHPSTDPAQALEVEAAMYAKGWFPRWCHLSISRPIGHMVSFEQLDGNSYRMSRAPTFCEALCLAAKAAVLSQEKQI